MNLVFSDFQPLLLIIAGLGLSLSLCTEQSQIVAKTRGAFAGKIATGYMSAMKIMMVNRAGSIIYVFFLSLCIDMGTTNQNLLLVSIASAMGVLVYNTTLVVNRVRVLSYDDPTSSESMMAFLFQRETYYTIAAFTATLCNILGLTLPFLLSNSFPEYRLTMANTGFLLNIFFTMITVMILETRYAKILDHGTNAEAYYYVVKIFLARVFSTIVALLVFVTLLFWLS